MRDCDWGEGRGGRRVGGERGRGEGERRGREKMGRGGEGVRKGERRRE